MKKILFFAAALVAISFASCCNNSTPAETDTIDTLEVVTDSVASDSVVADTTVAEVVD